MDEVAVLTVSLWGSMVLMTILSSYPELSVKEEVRFSQRRVPAGHGVPQLSTSQIQANRFQKGLLWPGKLVLSLSGHDNDVSTHQFDILLGILSLGDLIVVKFYLLFY